MQDPHETLVRVIHLIFNIAAITATVLPLAYAFVPWYKSLVGRVLMLHAVALALALDVTAVFRYWHTHNEELLLWIYITVISLVAIGTTSLAAVFFRSQYGERLAPVLGNVDGTIDVTVNDDGKKIYLLSLDSDPNDLDGKDHVVFKVNALTSS